MKLYIAQYWVSKNQVLKLVATMSPTLLLPIFPWLFEFPGLAIDRTVCFPRHSSLEVSHCIAAWALCNLDKTERRAHPKMPGNMRPARAPSWDHGNPTFVTLISCRIHFASTVGKNARPCHLRLISRILAPAIIATARFIGPSGCIEPKVNLM